MIGWHISVYRKRWRRSRPASASSSTGDRLAVWQAGGSGLDWIHELPPEDRAGLAGNGGYPLRFTARASVVVPVLRDGPPDAHPVWHVGSDSVVVDEARWPGRTVIDEAVVAACADDEWLVIEAWDES